jgi:hypothetical protein
MNQNVAHPAAGFSIDDNLGTDEELPVGERHMGDTARGADRLHLKSFFQSFQSVPQSFSPPQDYGGDHDVHVIDQVCGEELPDG